MITDIPTAAEFHNAGLNMLYMAWEIAVDLVSDLDQIEDMGGAIEGEEDEAAYWSKAQPALSNAFGLIQQAMEMALKARIASVSPYLLIDRNPKDWPGTPDKKDVPFSEFRTLDAADLVKVHNTFRPDTLSDDFRTFFDEVRRQRNVLMHSVPKQNFAAGTLVGHVLTAAKHLYSERRWPEHCVYMVNQSRFAAVGVGIDSTMNSVLRQVDVAIRSLSPADAKGFFSFEKRRAYVCPVCWDQADHDYQDSWPRLAQLTEKTATADKLHCVVCAATSPVERAKCLKPTCEGNVIAEGMCLTCLSYQDA